MGLLYLVLGGVLFDHPVACCPLHDFFPIVAHRCLVMSFFLMIGCCLFWLILCRVILVAMHMVLGLGVDVVVALYFSWT